MKKLLCALLLALPIGAFADHIDVIEVQLNEGCSVSEYVAIKDDFNAHWGAKNGYQSEVLVAIQSNNLTSLFWVGRTENAAAFGNAWDQWRNDLPHVLHRPIEMAAKSNLSAHSFCSSPVGIISAVSTIKTTAFSGARVR